MKWSSLFKAAIVATGIFVITVIFTTSKSYAGPGDGNDVVLCLPSESCLCFMDCNWYWGWYPAATSKGPIKPIEIEHQ